MPVVAIVGATGAVGREMLSVLERLGSGVRKVRCFASARSAGTELLFRGEKICVEQLTSSSFEGIDLALFSAGKKVALEYAPHALSAGTLVVDNSSAFREDPTVPLVIPEVNAHVLKNHRGIISCPNCCVAIMLTVLAPLHRKYHIKRIVAATYQAASGAGAQAMRELELETRAVLEGSCFARSVMPHPYAFNLFPHNSPMRDNGYAEEEIKMIEETKKILEDDSLRITATCVRVPVFRAHSEALNVEFALPVSREDALSTLAHAPGVSLFENWEKNHFPMPLEVAGKDEVFCGRIRSDCSQPNTLDLWVVGDQLLKGAALNAVQIALLLLPRLASKMIEC